MEPIDNAGQQRRGACLSILLTAGFAAFLLVVLIMATGGWAVYVVGVAVAIVGFAAVHYFLWGRMMMHQTLGEREEEEVRQQVETRLKERSRADSNGIQRRH
jgi:fatty acid desaturase